MSAPAIHGAPLRKYFRRSRRSRDLRLSTIKEMEILAARVPGVVSLAQGIPSFDTPEPIGRYVAEKIAAGECSRYSLAPGLPRLREMIAEALGREGMPYDPETEIIVTCGAIEGLSATLLAVLEPGDEVLLPSPSYASYPEVVRMAGGVPRAVPLVEEENFALDTDVVRPAITRRTRAILYANPNNPTGTIYTRRQIEELARLAEEHDLLIVTDEVYKDFVYPEEPIFSAARIEAVRDRVVRVFSFSKAYGMTGWRIGFLHSSAENVAEILKVHDALVTCAPVVSQYGAMAALELGEPFLREFREEFRRRRDRTLGHLDTLSHVFDYQKPNASYFVFPRVKDTIPLARDSRALALDVLDKARVAVVPGIAFGPSGEAHLRISYSRNTDDIDRAFERLGEYFRSSGTPPLRAPSAVPATAPRRRSARLRDLAVWYLAALSRFHLARNRPTCVAIAGLQGKTVMKRWFRELLERERRVRTNPRSYNTEIGLPLAILGAEIRGDRRWGPAAALFEATVRAVTTRPAADVLVLEMGLRNPGDATTLLRSVIPDVLVLTPIAPSFSDDLPFLDTVQAEVRSLAKVVAGSRGRILACRDDPRTLAAVSGIDGVELYALASFTAPDESGRGGVLAANGERYDVGLEVVGDNARYALVAGVEVARLLGVRDETIRSFLTGRG